MTQPLLLAIGDSVMWGQGLDDENKFYRLVCDSLSQRDEYAGMTATLMAHSGATIGAALKHTARAAPGEVPWSYPTIVQQCDSYDGDPDQVRVILLDGGINDVRVGAIVNPRTTSEVLSGLVELYCHNSMVTLLGAVARKFANCRIIVTGYYQILSVASSYAPTVSFLMLNGITDAAELISAGAGFSNLVDQSHRFWLESDQALAAAVDEVNDGVADGRISFVRSGFSEQNSVFQEGSLLWGFDGVPPFVNASDGLSDFRAQVCSNYYHDDVVGCAICRFASVGHPTASGAIRYYEQIMQAFP